MKMTTTEFASSSTFPIKLKKIVDAPETDHLIYWDEDGTSFHISDENKFARDIIPNYFKHCNISSFIRQLNMYGFHKVNRIENGLAIIGTGSDDSQWVHSNFIRDKPELLGGVVRKVTNNAFNNHIIAHKNVISNSNEIVPHDSVKSDIARLAKMVQFLKKRDEETSEQLKSLQQENNELCEELMYLREQHEQQSKCIDMLIEFFSQYAKKPHTLTSRLKPKRNILALECPQPHSANNTDREQHMNEPPRKFLVTSKSQQPNQNITNSDLFKGKKVIKISNFKQPTQIDIKTPKMSINPISNSNNSNIYHMPPILGGNSIGNQSQKTPIIYKLSLPGNAGIVSNKQPIRAITGSNVSAPIVVPVAPRSSTVSFPTTTSSTTAARYHRPGQKVVTVSTHNNSPEATTSNQPCFFDGLSSPVNNCDVGEEFGASRVNQHLPYGANSNRSTAVSDIISGISSNMTSFDKCLSDFNEMFDAETSYGAPMDHYQSQGAEVDSDLDEDWRMLLENIKGDESALRDPSRIHGNELIPFIESHGDVQGASTESYSIDDLLQTPEIHPGMSSLSLDYMDEHGASSWTKRP